MRNMTLLVLAAAAAACATNPEGTFVWVGDYKASAAPASTDIGPGDVLDVRVLGQDQLSAKVRVRDDGKITLPFLNDLQAAGRTPADLRALVEAGLKEYVNSPIVTVGVEKAPPDPILIMGEVAKPGKQPLEPGTGILDALAMAGGVTEYAHKDRVFVLRGSPRRTRIRFDLREMLRGEGPGLGFQLQPGDVIVVE